jgi:hypothetical protein
MKTKILFAAVLLTAGSCKKEKVESIDVGGDRLSKVIITEPAINRAGTGNYVYNSQGQLTSIVGTNNQNNTDTTWSLFTYNSSGHLSSFLVTNTVTGNQYKYDYTTDADGKVLSGKGTAMQPNMHVDNVKFAYDAKGRIISDSLFWPNGELHGYSLLQYDNGDNVVSSQDFYLVDTTISTIGKFTYQYDNKRSPFNKIGTLLYVVSPGSNGYFHLSKNNTTVAWLDSARLTPGGYFIYQYYNNDLLYTKKANVTNSLLQEFFYE